MRNHRQKGQISIVIGMMLMTFILFLAFVVNTGMLVNAKINLQNAADLAAYSGAATQARLLTNISFINYEMRRQYKKFLFRYYVLGNMAQKTFPRSGGGNSAIPWIPNASVSYEVPVICMIFNSQDNFCHLDKLPRIEIPDATPLDGINTTLRASLQTIEQIRQLNCEAIGKTNRLLALFWLYNADPNYEELSQTLTSANAADILNVIKGLAHGVGLVPREFILSQRIKTLQGYVNESAKTDLTLEKASALRSDATDPSRYERTVNAFFSAYQTLGENAFPPDQIWMDELLPQTDVASPGLLKLQETKAQFTTYALDYKKDSAGNCIPELLPIPLKKPLTFGFSKDPTALTYYALRLRAKPRILFNPFRELEIQAVAAAQPFGSRIGPKLEENDFIRTGATPQPRPAAAATSFFPFDKIPNLPIELNDSTARGKGWDNTRIGNIYLTMNMGGSPVIGQPDYFRGYQYAMVPNPWEGGKYNIPTDLGDDKFVRFFDNQKVMAFWAPIFPPGKESADTLREAIIEYLSDLSLANPTAQTNPLDPSNIIGSLQNVMTKYLADLKAGKGESDGLVSESINVFRMSDPFFSRPNDPTNGGAGAKKLTLGNNIMIPTDTPSQLRTSWENEHHDTEYVTGRIGYSVKIVPVESLWDAGKRTPASSDGQTWTNTMEIPSDLADQMPAIRH